MMLFLVTASIADACLRIAKMFVRDSISPPPARLQSKEVDKLSLYMIPVGLANCDSQHNPRPGIPATQKMATCASI